MCIFIMILTFIYQLWQYISYDDDDDDDDNDDNIIPENVFKHVKHCTLQFVLLNE